MKIHGWSTRVRPTSWPAVGEFVRDLGLIRTLDGQRALYRVRHEMEGTSFDTFGELGPPPDDLARAGRMNPAGIAYFYAAREPGTALGEVVTEPPARIAIGEFRPKDGLAVLDLTDLPEPPSVFDMDQYDRYQRLVFLGDFVERISMPVRKDGMEHVEYVPSQVVCEFFAQVFGRKDDGRPVDGIAYRSAVVPDGQNVVLFPPKGRRTWQDVAELVSDGPCGVGRPVADRADDGRQTRSRLNESATPVQWGSRPPIGMPGWHAQPCRCGKVTSDRWNRNPGSRVASSVTAVARRTRGGPWVSCTERPKPPIDDATVGDASR